jgi:hypothetical protein
MGGAKSTKDWVHAIEPWHVCISRGDLLLHHNPVWRQFMYKCEHTGKSLWSAVMLWNVLHSSELRWQLGTCTTKMLSYSKSHRKG